MEPRTREFLGSLGEERLRRFRFVSSIKNEFRKRRNRYIYEPRLIRRREREREKRDKEKKEFSAEERDKEEQREREKGRS